MTESVFTFNTPPRKMERNRTQNGCCGKEMHELGCYSSMF